MTTPVTENVTLRFNNSTTITYQATAFPALVNVDMGVQVDGTKTWVGSMHCWIHGSANSYNLHYHETHTDQGAPKITITPSVNAATGLLTITASESVDGVASVTCVV
jgi:hypothetical protein